MSSKTMPMRTGWQGEGPLAKFMVPQRKIDEAGRRITFAVSTAGRDRDGDIIDQSGWDVAEYRRNPVVLWAHDGSQPPIARAEEINVEGGRLVSTARFATREEYAFADTVFQLYKGGYLSGVSVGFMPDELDLIEGENPGDIGFRFRRQTLLEYSAVPIPSNPEALVVARAKGIDVTSCEDWITRLLDENGGGSVKGLLSRTYIMLKGRLHPVLQAELASKNAATLRDKADDAAPVGKQDDEDDRPTLTTGAGGEDGHTHTLRHGEMQTEAGGEDGHVHAVNYAEDGEITVEGAEGHTHDAPAAQETRNGAVDSEDEVSTQTPTNNPLDPDRHGQPEGQRALTDWPQKGMSMPVSLLTSEYRPFPLAEAKALRDDWPEIWGMADGPDPETIASDEEAIRAREDWAAKHVDGHTLECVVGQIKQLVRGSRGIEHMRLVLSHAKEHVMNRRDQAKGLEPEEVEAVIDRVVTRGVVPVLEQAFRRQSGRVS